MKKDKHGLPLEEHKNHGGWDTGFHEEYTRAQLISPMLEKHSSWSGSGLVQKNHLTKEWEKSVDKKVSEFWWRGAGTLKRDVYWNQGQSGDTIGGEEQTWLKHKN